MEHRTPIILVTGPPASGKTFIAQLLADRLDLPLIAKDAIKETLYDQLGTGDVEWSRRLGRTTFALMYHALESQLRAHQSVIVEANFVAEDARAELLALRERHPFVAVEVHCTAEQEVLVSRYAGRASSRHAGHIDSERIADITSAIADDRHDAIRLGEDVIAVDTTSFDNLDGDAIVESVRDRLARFAARSAGPS